MSNLTEDTTTLTAWLLVQIAEDEAVAQEVRPHDHLRTRDDSMLTAVFDGGYAKAVATSGRVLRECAAKRAIVELHGEIDPCDAHDGASMESVPCDTLRALASVYADRDGWREEWAL